MQCPSCGQQTEVGKFCTNCGAPLPDNDVAGSGTGMENSSGGSPEAGSQQTNEPALDQTQAAAAQQTPQEEQTNEQQPPNEAVEKIKEIGNDFSNFFLTLVKKPSAAKQANQNDWISSVITIGIYALVFALGYFFTLKIVGDPFSSSLGDLTGGSTSVPFTDGFLWPFLKFVVLFAIILGVTFTALKLATSDFNFLETLSKYGAYLMPFTLLLILGYLLFFIKLEAVGVVVLFVSFFAAVFIIPTILLMEEKSSGIDRMYLMVITHVINFAVFFYLIFQLLLPVFIMNGIGEIMDDMGF